MNLSGTVHTDAVSLATIADRAARVAEIKGDVRGALAHIFNQWMREQLDCGLAEFCKEINRFAQQDDGEQAPEYGYEAADYLLRAIELYDTASK